MMILDMKVKLEMSELNLIMGDITIAMQKG